MIRLYLPLHRQNGTCESSSSSRYVDRQAGMHDLDYSTTEKQGKGEGLNQRKDCRAKENGAFSPPLLATPKTPKLDFQNPEHSNLVSHQSTIHHLLAR